MAVAIVVGAVFPTACSDEDNGDKQADSSGVSTSLLVATDRHEAGEGNNLAVAVQMAVSRPFFRRKGTQKSRSLRRFGPIKRRFCFS